MADPALNPFSDDVFDPDHPDFSRGGVEWIHLSALVQLKAAADDAAGRQDFGAGKVALVTAPRAGFGKSHLIARFLQLIGDDGLHLPARFDPDGELTWTALLQRLVSELDSRREPGADCSLLDGAGRRAFAAATREMIAESKIPSADPAEAIAALENDPIGLFDFANQQQVVSRWFNQYFTQLRPTVAEILAKACGIANDKAKAWATRFHHYASLPDDPSRANAFAVSLPQGDESTSKQSLHELLRIISGPRPTILTVDDLDGYFRERDAGQRLAHMLLEVAKMSPRALVVIAANDDLWEASFGLHIASAYEDRLTARRICLGGLDPVRAGQLVRNRMLATGGSGREADEFESYLALDGFLSSDGTPRPVSTRAVLRYAAHQWGRFCAGEPSPAARQPAGVAPPEPAAKAGGIAPIPTPSEPAGESAKSWSEEPPTSVEILDESTRESISEAAMTLVDSNSVTKAPQATGDKPDEESRDPEEGKIDDVVPELVGHTQPAAPDATGKNGNTDPLTVPPTVFAEDEDNPFQKLKRMLNKLRTEREEQRQMDSGTLVEAERKRIEQEEAKETSEDPGKPEVAPPHERTPLTSAAEWQLQRVEPTREDFSRGPLEPAMLGHFRRERDLILAAGTTLPILQPTLCALARAAGERFPVVTLDDPEIGGGESAVRWAFDDTEILFGNRPGRDRAYWDKLGAYAKSRVDGGTAHVKMIIFSSADETIVIDSILGGSDDLIGIADFTILDRQSLASLYAAHRLITGTTAAGADITPDSEDALGKLAGELDFFWKRVTRPLPGARGATQPGARGATQSDPAG